MKSNAIQLILLAALVLASALGQAAKKTAAGGHYFYSLPQAEGAASEWGYKIPECAPLADKDFRKLKRQCKHMGTNAQVCATEKTVTLKRGAANPGETPAPKVMKDAQKVDDTTKTFKLDYVVFKTLDDCKEAHEHELEGE